MVHQVVAVAIPAPLSGKGGTFSFEAENVTIKTGLKNGREF